MRRDARVDSDSHHACGKRVSKNPFRIVSQNLSISALFYGGESRVRKLLFSDIGSIAEKRIKGMSK